MSPTQAVVAVRLGTAGVLAGSVALGILVGRAIHLADTVEHPWDD